MCSSLSPQGSTCKSTLKLGWNYSVQREGQMCLLATWEPFTLHGKAGKQRKAPWMISTGSSPTTETVPPTALWKNHQREGRPRQHEHVSSHDWLLHHQRNHNISNCCGEDQQEEGDRQQHHHMLVLLSHCLCNTAVVLHQLLCKGVQKREGRLRHHWHTWSH